MTHISACLSHPSDEELSEKYSRLTRYFDKTRADYAETIKLDFSSNMECSIRTDGIAPNINDPELIEYLLELKNSGQKLSTDDIQSIGYSDEWLVGEMSIEPEEDLNTIGINGALEGYALLAFSYNKKALDLLSYVQIIKFDNEDDQWHCQVFPFHEACREDQIKNLMKAFEAMMSSWHHLHTAKILKTLPSLEYISSPIVSSSFIEEQAKLLADDIATKKARERAVSRHADNHKKQERVIEVYESGEYKKQYQTPYQKTKTAKRILRHVNEWCRSEGIPIYQETGTGGIKTVKQIIDRYEKKKSVPCK
ncbi:hypothetical protein [Endozoicomonas sp. SCSIO W0465]|uniref:hypothetical protein n=1 Tax=Endozoicomonas sp. SCSIO W0465 TaxID=2918516 RepID=UPI002075FC06|nr:hypothetical protein [Endozoicomonas sp. SCSIO W0465]USE35533.1 hypothetical protein MJO57_26145 [Endozoicomonas sp. SCSIO W0465]